MAGNRVNSESANWPCPLERKDKRLAIIETARAIAAEYGFSAVTLGAVAEKMGFAPAAIYGCFATRNELLEQLSLDDPPREDEPGAPDASCEDPPPQKQDMAPEPEPEPEAAVQPDEDQVPSEYSEMLRLQAEELDKLAKRIIVPKSSPREGTDAARRSHCQGEDRDQRHLDGQEPEVGKVGLDLFTDHSFRSFLRCRPTARRAEDRGRAADSGCLHMAQDGRTRPCRRAGPEVVGGRGASDQAADAPKATRGSDAGSSSGRSPEAQAGLEGDWFG